MDPWPRGRRPRVPVFLQQRPECLVGIGGSSASRAPQNAFLDGAQLPERSVRAAVLDLDARLHSMDPHRPERERADEARRLDKHPRAACRWGDGALPFGGLERGIELTHLDETDRATSG